MLAQRLPDGRCLDSSAPERDQRGRLPHQSLAYHPLLDLAEDALLEQLRNRAFARLDQRVHVDVWPLQTRRGLLTERRLPGPHEADQRDLPP